MGKDRPVTTIEDPIEIQWAKQPEPEPEPEPAAEPASWAGVHPAMEGAALGTALQRAADARSYEEVHADPPPFPASGPERDVIEWLGQAGLAKHAEALVAMGLRSMAHCGSVSPEDLAAAGMTEAGGACVDCLQGLDCPVGSTSPPLLEGYMVLAEDRLRPYRYVRDCLGESKKGKKRKADGNGSSKKKKPSGR